MEQQSPQGDAGQCIFCKIASGEVPSRKLYEDELVLAVLDITPATPGHILIIPKQHVMVMPQLKPEVMVKIGLVVKALSKALLQTFKCDGTSMFMANGAAAGQRAPHFMVHLMPRMKDDGLPIHLDEQDVEDSYLKKLKAKLTGEPAQEENQPEPKPEGAQPATEDDILGEPQEKAKETEKEGNGGNESQSGDEFDPDLIEDLFG